MERKSLRNIRAGLGGGGGGRLPQIDENMVYAMVLGKVIARHRERRGWSQGDLATRLNVGQSTISRFEAGQSQPDTFTFRALARVFGVTVADLSAQVDRAVERTRLTARAAAPPAEELPWWTLAVGIAGIAGLAALAAFAVAAVLQADLASGKGEEEDV